MKICPNNTLSIIAELERLGFNNQHFQFIHHWGNLLGKDSSLESHKRYLSQEIQSYKPHSNNFNVALKLQKCLDVARYSKKPIDFVEIGWQLNSVLQPQKIDNNFNSGLYVVTLNNSQAISANADDKRIAHKAIKVNKENCKFGKSVNLEKRKYNYYKTFGQENVNFIPIASLSEIELAEQEILKQLSPYRLISPSGNLTEWMQGINASKIIDLAIEILDKLKIYYEILSTNKSDTKPMVNFSQLSKQINEAVTQPKKQSIQEAKQSGFNHALPDNYQLDEYTQKAYHALTIDKKPVVFLTGRAGTGKSTFIQYVKQNYTGNFVILTPTGMTALNIGGQTIHSFFRFPPRAFEDDQIAWTHNAAIDHLDLIIIDEISMVQSDMLDHIDFALRKWRESSIPFAGIQLLLVGDCFQLSPWIKFGAEKQRFEEMYRSQWFFDANVFERVDVVPINLEKIYRQRDLYFTNLLNRIRIKYDHERCVEELNQRCYFEKQGLNVEDQLILTTTNAHADTVNAKKLDKLDNPSTFFQAKSDGKITKDINKSIPERLELKVGAQVMVIKNIAGAANGTLATVTKLFPDKVIIKVIKENLEDGQEIVCTEEVWEQFEYDWNDSAKKISSHKTGTYKQIPLRLGWAITTHKSQGLTFDAVRIDLTGGAFAPGQTYVALSRCRTLEKISFERPISLKDIIVDPKIYTFYTQLFNS